MLSVNHGERMVFMNEKRFEIVMKQRLGFATLATILEDTQTGVRYLFYENGNSGGLTPLLNSNGELQMRDIPFGYER